MKKLLASLLLGLACQTGVLAQTTFSATYSFGPDSSNNVASFAYNGTPVPNASVGNMVKTGVTSSSGAGFGNFRATGWTTNAAANTNQYFGFSVTADPGFTLAVSNLSFGIGRSGTGPRRWVWYVSTNGFTTSEVLTNYSSLNTNFVVTNGVIFTPTNNLNFFGNVVQVPSLGGATNAEFRLYAYSASSTLASGGLAGAFTFTGSVSSLAGDEVVWYGDGVNPGGAGTWSDTGTNWFDTETSTLGVWNPAKPARFGTAGGAVVVDPAGITASDSTIFSADGYTLSGGAITFAAASNSISTDTNVAAVISNELAGAASWLVKDGAGTLVLAGSNSFAGGVELDAGALQIAADAGLGASTNPLVLAGGTLAVATNLTVGSPRTVSGSGSFDIPEGSVLTLDGSVTNTATTLVNLGTLHLAGSVRGLGSLAFTAPGLLSASGDVFLTDISTAAVTNGMVTLQANLTFPTGDQTIAAGPGVTVEVNGSVSGLGTGRILKTGAGTLVLNGSNSVGAIRVGAAGAVPVDGGTFIVNDPGATGSGQAQLQAGTLRTDVPGGLTLPNGLSIAGRDGAVAVLSGEPLTFAGANDFFASSGTSGELRLDVDNETVFNGSWGGVSGDGTATGITIGGSGLLVLNGNASALTSPVTLSNIVTVQINTFLGTTSLLVETGNVLTGNGTVAGDITVNGTIVPGSANARGNLTSGGTLSVPGTAVLRIFANGINDQLSASNSIDFPGIGSVQVVPEPGWTPAIGDTFPLVGFGTIGTLPFLSLPVLTNTNLVWNTNQFAASGIIEVADANPLPPNYANWLTNYPGLVPPDDEGTADPDGDGYDNFSEFAFDGNPTVPGFIGLTARRQGTNSVFNWVQRKNPPGGVTYVIKRTTDLANGPWVNAADLTITNAADQSGVLLPSDYERKEFRVGPADRSYYFLEAKITP